MLWPEDLVRQQEGLEVFPVGLGPLENVVGRMRQVDSPITW